MAARTQPTWFAGAATALARPVLQGFRWWLGRLVTVGYGLVYDYIYERFPPYRALQQEVLETVRTSAPGVDDRHRVRVLDIDCGLGNLGSSLAEAGFTVLGLDAYDGLIELAREKRHAEGLSNLSFLHADVTDASVRLDGMFDVVVNVHSLYAHAAPDEVLRAAWRALKPGGHAIFVNFTRRVPLWVTFRTEWARAGTLAALRCLLWVLPNVLFEAMRRPVGPHYWDREQFAARLAEAGFRVLAMRPTFFHQASLLAWVSKDDSA